MDQIEFERECYSFDEKIALAELEESKAAQRVKELKYQKSRFCLEAFLAKVRGVQKKG